MKPEGRKPEDGALHEGAALDGLDAALPGAAAAALAAFSALRDGAEHAPSRTEAADYLTALTARKGRATGCAEFGWLQIAAAHAWGASESACFATVLREFRVSKKKVRKSEWQRAEVAIAALPEAWQTPIMAVLSHSRDDGLKRRGAIVWSASHIAAVSRALAQWHRFCLLSGHDAEPSGQRFQDFAEALAADGVTPRSVHSYLQRVLSGYSGVISPGFQAPGCDFIISEYRSASDRSGPTTKPAQVAARDLYCLGLQLMDEARDAAVMGIRTALTFRDGLMIALAVALPQRARALSALEIGSTIGLDDWPSIWVHLPGTALKLPQARKRGENFAKTIRNPDLWAAISEYLTVYRPIFDDGSALFPSKNAPGEGISEGQIGRHIGGITQRRLGVRIPIHRFRDCVATEAAEEMERGAVLTPALLGQRDRRTAERHYDHSEGVRVAREFAELTGSLRGRRIDLDL